MRLAAGSHCCWPGATCAMLALEKLTQDSKAPSSTLADLASGDPEFLDFLSALDSVNEAVQASECSKASDSSLSNETGRHGSAGSSEAHNEHCPGLAGPTAKPLGFLSGLRQPSTSFLRPSTPDVSYESSHPGQDCALATAGATGLPRPGQRLGTACCGLAGGAVSLLMVTHAGRQCVLCISTSFLSNWRRFR